MCVAATIRRSRAQRCGYGMLPALPRADVPPPIPLPPQVEEGLCQLLACLWLDQQHDALQGVSSKRGSVVCTCVCVCGGWGGGVGRGHGLCASVVCRGDGFAPSRHPAGGLHTRRHGLSNAAGRQTRPEPPHPHPCTEARLCARARPPPATCRPRPARLAPPPPQDSEQQRLASYLAYSIRNDTSEVYGDGFREAFEVGWGWGWGWGRGRGEG